MTSHGDWRRQQKEQDDKEYFSHHKASPLSEIEVADSRKPLTKVMYGTADGYEVGDTDELILFRPEQRRMVLGELPRCGENLR